MNQADNDHGYKIQNQKFYWVLKIMGWGQITTRKLDTSSLTLDSSG